MKAIFVWSGALLLAGAAAPLAQAQWLGNRCSPVYQRPLPSAPDATGPGFYAMCPSGTVYGPNYYLRPCWNPTTPVSWPRQPLPSGAAGLPGMEGVPGAKQATLVFPTHPFARSPRDFFMVD